MSHPFGHSLKLQRYPRYIYDDNFHVIKKSQRILTSIVNFVEYRHHGIRIFSTTLISARR